MLRRFSVNFALLSIALDALFVAAGLYLSVRLRPALNALPFAQRLDAGDADIPAVLYFVFPLVWVLVLLLFNVYDGRRNLRVANEMSSLILGSGLAVVASAGALYLSYREVSRLQFILFGLLAALALGAWRLGLRMAMRWRGFDTTRRRVLVVGAGETGQEVRTQVVGHARLGLVFLGFLDDEREGDDVVGYLADVRKTVLGPR